MMCFVDSQIDLFFSCYCLVLCRCIGLEQRLPNYGSWTQFQWVAKVIQNLD